MLWANLTHLFGPIVTNCGKSVNQGYSVWYVLMAIMVKNV